MDYSNYSISKLFRNRTYCLLIVFFLFYSFAILANSTDNDSIYTVVDRTPKFRGKPGNVSDFIQQNIVYPDEAWVNEMEGVVKISFIVTKDGHLMHAEVENSVDPLLDMEALRVVDLMSHWRPGRKDGEDVHTKVSVPVKFRLSTDEKEFINTLKRYDLHEKPPLFVIDNKIVHNRVHIPSYNVRSVRVVKGERAIERYGKEAENGVVIITTKRGTPPVR